MKDFFYSVYALIFNFYSLFTKVKKDKIAFISMHNENFCDSLGETEAVLKEKGYDDFLYITREDLSFRNPKKLFEFFFVKSFYLSKCGTYFLNDNFLPLGKLKLKKEVRVVELWHAEGAFKKFGFHIPQPKNLRKAEKAFTKKLSYVICSSENVREIYAEAFGIEKEKVLPLGSPRTDFLKRKANQKKALEEIHSQFPQTKGKKILLYAPTFREDKERNSEIIKSFNPAELSKLLGEEYVIFLRLHPQIHEKTEIKNAVDVTDFKDVRKLILASDVLVTDYSSICMDFAFLRKKIIFFAYDLEYYKGSRDFYFDYETFVPGEIARTTKELYEAIKLDFNFERNERFRKFNFDFDDDKSGERVVKALFDI